MKNLKFKGIVLYSKDYKENDKILTLFTLEYGLLYAKLVGVKKPNAKLKIIKDVFCFADFEAVSKSDFITITSAEVIETFHDITSDIDKYYTGCNIIKILRAVCFESQPNQALFVETLKCLKYLSSKNVDNRIIEIKFYLKIFEALGYQLSLKKCSICGDNFINKRYYSIDEGAIVCYSCKSKDSIEISNLCHSVLRLIAECDYEKLHSLKLNNEALIEALNFIMQIYKDKIR